MAVIQEILDGVDAAVAGIGATVFNSVAGSVLPVFQVSAVLVIILTGINLMIQAVPMTLQNGISLMVRIALVFIFLTSFANFNAVYGVLTDTPSRFGATILQALTGSATDNLYSGLDQLYSNSLDVGNAVAQNGSYIAGAIAGVVMFLISALMATVSIIVICAAKLMIGVLIILGPLAIATIMFKQSAPIFEAYVKLALGFAFVPLLAAAMAGFTILAAENVTPSDLSSVENIGDLVSFIVVMMLGTGLMAMIPTIAQSLAQTGLGIGAAVASTYVMGRGAASAASKGASGMRTGYDKAKSRLGSDASGSPTSSPITTANKAVNLAQRQDRKKGN